MGKDGKQITWGRRSSLGGKHGYVLHSVATFVGVEKVGTDQLIFMRSVWRLEMFSSIV
jgi:hypothetical protein